MRRLLILGTCLVLVASVSACSGGSSKSADKSTNDSAAATGQQRMSLTQLRDKMLNAGIKCDAKVHPYDSNDGTPMAKITVSEQLDCSDANSQITALGFGTEIDAKAWAIAAQTFGCVSAAGEFSYVITGNVLATATTADGSKPDDAATQKIANAIGAHVTRVRCPADSGTSGSLPDVSTDDSGDPFAPSVVDVHAPQTAKIGDFMEDGKGVRVKVNAIRAALDDQGALGPTAIFEVDLRVENATGQAIGVPTTQLVCNGLTDGPGVMSFSSDAKGGTIASWDRVSAGAYLEGTMRLSAPGASSGTSQAATCASPAVVRFDMGDRKVDVPVPDSVLRDFNDKVASQLVITATPAAPSDSSKYTVVPVPAN